MSCYPPTDESCLLAPCRHPDKVRGTDAEKAAATEKFKEIGEAYGEHSMAPVHLPTCVHSAAVVHSVLVLRSHTGNTH